MSLHSLYVACCMLYSPPARRLPPFTDTPERVISPSGEGRTAGTKCGERKDSMKTSESPPLLELWLPADPKAVPPARHQAMQACTNAGLAEEECFALDLALGEALANAVMHGAPRAGDVHADDRHVCLSLWGYGDRLIMHIRDRGPGFRPPPPPYPMPSAAWGATCGRGLPLMETLTDAMVVCRADAEHGGASVYLVKKVVR